MPSRKSRVAATHLSPIIYLLGAGASVEAGIPTSKQITDVFLNYSSVCPTREGVGIENLLRYVQLRLATHFDKPTSAINFELILGAVFELLRRSRNPVTPLLGDGDKLIEKIEKTTPLPRVAMRLHALLREQFEITEPTDYLAPIARLHGTNERIDFFTLNYDLVLEKVLRDQGVNYTNGFVKIVPGGWEWSPAVFDDSQWQARVFKLHGSIDWGYVFFAPAPRSEYASPDSVSEANLFVANPPKRRIVAPFEINKMEMPGSRRGIESVLNFGVRKDHLYSTSQFTILFSHFVNALYRAKVCIVAGYSWQDERINTLIEEALSIRKGALRLLMVDPLATETGFKKPMLFSAHNLGLTTFVPSTMGAFLKNPDAIKYVNDLLQSGESCFKERASVYVRIAQNELGRRPTKDKEAAAAMLDELHSSIVCCLHHIQRINRALHKLEGKQTPRDSLLTAVMSLHFPIVKHLRDICYFFSLMYEYMGFAAEYDITSLDRCTPSAEIITDQVDLAALSKQIEGLDYMVHRLFGRYSTDAPQAKDALFSPKLADTQEEPSNFQMAELIMRNFGEDLRYALLSIDMVFAKAGGKRPFETVIPSLNE